MNKAEQLIRRLLPYEKQKVYSKYSGEFGSENPPLREIRGTFWIRDYNYDPILEFLFEETKEKILKQGEFLTP